MYLSFLCLSFMSALISTEQTTDFKSEVVKLASPNDAPYSVLLIIGTELDVNECSGSLLTLEWVLTAAVCFQHLQNVKNLTDIEIYAGITSSTELYLGPLPRNSQVQKGASYYSHPQYRPNLDNYKNVYNIALVKTGQKFKQSRTVGTVKISLQPWNFNFPRNCTVTTFGRIKLFSKSPLDSLKKTYKVQIISPCNCLERDRHPEMWLCSQPIRGIGICSGQFGAGLVCDGRLGGVVSSVLPVGDIKSCDVGGDHVIFDCGANNTMNVFENVCNSLVWINSHVKLLMDIEVPEICGLLLKSYSKGATTRSNVSVQVYINVLFLFSIRKVLWYFCC